MDSLVKKSYMPLLVTRKALRTFYQHSGVMRASPTQDFPEPYIAISVEGAEEHALLNSARDKTSPMGMSPAGFIPFNGAGNEIPERHLAWVPGR
jgi:hypothetical protein